MSALALRIVLIAFCMSALVPIRPTLVRAADLTAKVKEIEDAIRPLDADQRKKLRQLITAIDCSAEGVKLDQCDFREIEIRLKQMIAAAGDAKKNERSDEILKDILNSDQFADTDLRKSLLAVVDPKPVPVLHVIAAFYGHLEDLDRLLRKTSKDTFSSFADDAKTYMSDRICNATAAIRTACHGKPICLGEGTLSGEKLCGFEPAPFAPNRFKALFVGYRCSAESLSPKLVAEDDKIHRHISTGVRQTAERRWALLRQNETTSIGCALSDMSDAPAAPMAKPGK